MRRQLGRKCVTKEKHRVFAKRSSPGHAAAFAVTPPYSPQDLAATIYHAPGINHEMRLPDTQGRPVGIMDDGQPILELFG